jgi:hypothetical protein
VIFFRETAGGQPCSYPVIETVPEDNIGHLYSLLLKPRSQTNDCQTPGGAGVFDVEMFLMADGVSESLQTVFHS